MSERIKRLFRILQESNDKELKEDAVNKLADYITKIEKENLRLAMNAQEGKIWVAK